jgi:hypothetical protein
VRILGDVAREKEHYVCLYVDPRTRRPGDCGTETENAPQRILSLLDQVRFLLQLEHACAAHIATTPRFSVIAIPLNDSSSSQSAYHHISSIPR